MTLPHRSCLNGWGSTSFAAADPTRLKNRFKERYMFKGGLPPRVSVDSLVDELLRLDKIAFARGFATLESSERYLFGEAVAQAPLEVIDGLASIDDRTRNAIIDLESTGYRTYSRVIAALLAPLAESGTIYTVDRSPIPDGPAAIFVPNVGGQYPVRG